MFALASKVFIKIVKRRLGMSRHLDEDTWNGGCGHRYCATRKIQYQFIRHQKCRRPLIRAWLLHYTCKHEGGALDRAVIYRTIFKKLSKFIIRKNIGPCIKFHCTGAEVLQGVTGFQHVSTRRRGGPHTHISRCILLPVQPRARFIRSLTLQLVTGTFINERYRDPGVFQRLRCTRNGK